MNKPRILRWLEIPKFFSILFTIVHNQHCRRSPIKTILYHFLSIRILYSTRPHPSFLWSASPGLLPVGRHSI